MLAVSFTWKKTQPFVDTMKRHFITHQKLAMTTDVVRGKLEAFIVSAMRLGVIINLLVAGNTRKSLVTQFKNEARNASR